MPRFSQLLVLVIYLVGACSSNKDTSGSMANEASLGSTVRSDTQQRGCKGVAGYRWSTLQKKCVRLSDAGIRLESQGGDRSAVAYVLFAPFGTDGRAEVFLPGDKVGRLMDEMHGENNGSWTVDTLTLRQWKSIYTLAGAKGRVLYEGQLLKEPR